MTTKSKLPKLRPKEAYVLEQMEDGRRAVYIPYEGARAGYWGLNGKSHHLAILSLVCRGALCVFPHAGERVAEISPLGRALLTQHRSRVQVIANG